MCSPPKSSFLWLPYIVRFFKLIIHPLWWHTLKFWFFLDVKQLNLWEFHLDSSTPGPFPGAANLWTAPATPSPCPLPFVCVCFFGGWGLFCFVLFGIQFTLASSPLSRNHFKVTQSLPPNSTMKKGGILLLWDGENPPNYIATLPPCPVVETAAVHLPPPDSRRDKL